MLTGKQRSYLKSLAHELEPTVYVGKFGMTENIIKEMEIGFETRELVKIKLQEGCELSKDEVA
ncbi:MAG: YhbY family RNA-binding protein, partial [Firmicutes bacterium]|nr:YhbY family RNA-binding protein [Bacillota bacterium]